MKRFNRVACLFLAIILCLAVPVHAQDASTYANSYIAAYGAWLEKPASFQIEVWFNITGTGMCDELGVSEIIVQRSSTGTGDWDTMRTFYPEYYPQMISENDYSHISYVTYIGAPGYYYRAIVIFYSRKGNGVGQEIYYTGVLYL